jgi:integrase
MRPDNPVHGLARFADGKRDRRLSDEEYAALGDALRQAESSNIWPPAIAATRFLALTGWRRNEALELLWKEIDLSRRTTTLPDTKSGKSIRPLSHAACDVLRNMPRVSELVFPATRGNAEVIMSGFKKIWKKIAALGKLPVDVTPHTLRHSFISLAADLGYSEPTIAAPVGHAGRTTTSRYVHAADAVLLSTTDAVAEKTAELMGEPAVEARVIPLRLSQA